MKRKTVIRRGIIAVILVATAVGGHWYANRTAAAILRPCFPGLLELNDTDGVLLVLRRYPGLGRKAWEQNAFFTEDEYKQDEGRQTPLHWASRTGNPRIVEALVAADVKVNAEDYDYDTPLHLAAREGHDDVVRLLLDAGANVNARRGDGWTPAHDAVVENHVNMVKQMLNAGAIVNSQNIVGWTLLHEAAWAGHIDVVLVLINAGADVNIRDEDGETPLYYAHARQKWSGREDKCAALLRKHGAKTGAELKAEAKAKTRPAPK